MKKKIFIIALAVICISIAACGTLAYFTYEDTATNVITTGDITIKLEEWSKNADDTLVPFKNLGGAMPGDTVSKIVQIKNTGKNSAWVRISVESSIALADGSAGAGDMISCNLNTEAWTYLDGYYYYNSALAAGETTEPLFTEVHLSEQMGNEYQSCKATVSVVAYATQVANNGSSVFDANGWPADNGGNK